MTIWWILLILIWPFAFVLLFGAPYLPSRRFTIQRALKLLDLKEGELLVDLGSGDGAVLVVAAQAGLRAVGYEMNPLLWLVAKLRTVRYGKRVRIYCRNFWVSDWPPETAGVYVFLHTRFMSRLDHKLNSLTRPTNVVSYTFKIPGKKVIRETQALYLYRYVKE